MQPTSLKLWIDQLQMQGRYSFLRSEVVRASDSSQGAISKALQRAVASGRLIRPKQYFYVIVPLEYSAAGAPPVSWFIHDLMAAMNQTYYVGLLTAAGLFGASHQQPQVFQVMTDRPVRPILAGRASINFFASKFASKAKTVDLKTPTGAMRVSSPETTVVDLVRFASSAGHLDHVSSVVAQLVDSLSAKRLIAALKVAQDIPNAQRLGYILETLGEHKLSDSLHRWAEKRIKRFQPLRSGRSVKGATENKFWRLLINGGLEVEP